MNDSGLKLLLEKQQSLLKELLDFSQRQFTETDSVGLDNLLSQKDKCFEELKNGINDTIALFRLMKKYLTNLYRI